MKDYRILQGDVREVLATLPDESVHCVVTSPPYWGLRDYQLPPSVWGGGAGCEHEWVAKGRYWDNRHAATVAAGIEAKGLLGGKADARGTVYSDTCALCGAWRGTLGLEPTPGEFVQHMVEIFREVRRVLRRDGTLWLNMGDSYANAGQTGNDRRGTLHDGGKPRYTPIAGLKPKDLVGMPWRVAFALQEDGWWLRSAITWCKRAPMPESVTDRPTSATEQIFLLAKSERYYYDQEAVRDGDAVYTRKGGDRPLGGVIGEGRQDRERFMQDITTVGRNMRNFWLLGPEPYAAAHFATFPTAIPDRCVRAGTSERGCCPECGAPWRRVVERTPYTPQVVAVGERNVDASRGDKTRKLSGKEYNEQASSRTIGWQPTCKCGRTDTVPAVVLDPFSGAGTTCLVALRLGRRAIGIELSPDYVAMSHKRIQGDPQAMNLNMELVEMEESA